MGSGELTRSRFESKAPPKGQKSILGIHSLLELFNTQLGYCRPNIYCRPNRSLHIKYKTNEYSSVPIKLHWQKSMEGHIWPMGHSLSTSTLSYRYHGEPPTAIYIAYWVFRILLP